MENLWLIPTSLGRPGGEIRRKLRGRDGFERNIFATYSSVHGQEFMRDRPQRKIVDHKLSPTLCRRNTEEVKGDNTRVVQVLEALKGAPL